MSTPTSLLQSTQFSAAPARASVRRPLLWLALGFTVGTGCLIALALGYLRTQAIESGERLTRSFTQVIEEQTSRTLQTIDQRLQLASLGLTNLAASHQLNEQSARLLLRQQVKELPFVRAIWVLDAQGRIQYDSDEGNIGVSLADRPYFQIYRTQPQTKFYVGNPVRSRSTGTWLISAARPLQSANGSVEGVIVAAMEPPYFDKLWRSIDLGAGGSIALFRNDGTLMMRSPLDDGAMGKVFSTTRLFKELLPANSAGNYRSSSAIDGTVRAFAYRTLTARPELLVVIGQSFDLMLAPWRQLASLALTIWLAASAAVIGLCLFLNRVWQQRLRAEATLRESEQRFKLAASTGNVWDWNLLTEQVTFPQEFWRALGYGEHDVGNSTTMLASILHPQDLAHWQQAVIDHIGQRLSYDFDYRARTKSGEYRWFNTKGQARWDENGRATYMAGTTFDITERKRTQEALREKEFLLSESQRLAHIGSWQIELASGQISWTEEAYRIYGIEAQTFTHDMASFYPLVHPDDQAAMKEWGRACRAGERPGELEFRAILPDGSLRFLTGFGDMQYDADKQPVRMIGTVQDITGRKRTEVALEQRSVELAALNTLSKQVNASLQLQQVAQAVLAESLRTAAPDLALLFLRNGSELQLLASTTQGGRLGDTTTPVHRLGECLCGLAAAQGKAMYSRDIHADPRCTWNECKQAGVRSFAALPLRSGDTVIGVLGLASASDRDFESQAVFLETFAEQATAGLKNAQMHGQIERHVVELEQRVRERTAELETAKTRAEAADGMKSAFLATMSHELRTPLNSIIGFTGVLLQKLPGPLNAEQEKQLGFVQNAGRHLLALICDVLDISKVEAGELHLVHERLDLRALLDRLGAAFAPQAQRRNLGFILDIEGTELVAYGDARRVEQVLNNLLSNALKFTPGGRITLACRCEKDRFVVSVTDTGVGIKADDMDKLFRPFGQIETGMPGVREGTGLGLAISKHLVEAMGGEVRATSEWGKGSCFSFTLAAKEIA